MVGRWFTDSPESLTVRILQRPSGGTIIVVRVPKERLEELRAVNHPVAKDMDIEPDNFILPDELISGAQTVPVTVFHQNPNKYLFKEVRAIRVFVDTLIEKFKHSSSAGNPLL